MLACKSRFFGVSDLACRKCDFWGHPVMGLKRRITHSRMTSKVATKNDPAQPSPARPPQQMGKASNWGSESVKFGDFDQADPSIWKGIQHLIGNPATDVLTLHGSTDDDDKWGLRPIRSHRIRMGFHDGDPLKFGAVLFFRNKTKSVKEARIALQFYFPPQTDGW